MNASEGGQGDAGAQVTAALNAFQKDMPATVVRALRTAKTQGMV